MEKINYENNFIYLCSSLLILLFSAALVQEFPTSIGDEFLSIVSILMLMISIKSLNIEMGWRRIVYILIALLIFLNVLSRIFEFQYIVYFNLVVLLIFFVGSFDSAYKQIFFVGRVDKNKLIGSLSLYLLIGMIWTVIYLILLQYDSSAFSGIEPGNWQQNFSRVAYYSFVTLTTLGYGEILPAKPLAEFFVYIEAVIGVFFMAIIVSSLVSISLSNHAKKDQ